MTIKNGNLLVQVTEEDIKDGIVADSSCCGIALALKRTLGVDNVQVHLEDDDVPELRVGDTLLSIPKKYYEPICEFIKRFDNKNDYEFLFSTDQPKEGNYAPPQPFEFEIGEDQQ